MVEAELDFSEKDQPIVLLKLIVSGVGIAVALKEAVMEYVVGKHTHRCNTRHLSLFAVFKSSVLGLHFFMPWINIPYSGWQLRQPIVATWDHEKGAKA